MQWSLSSNQSDDQPWDRRHPVVPFRRMDDEWHLGGYWRNVDWFIVDEFAESMTIVDYQNGNGSASFTVRDCDDFNYRVSLGDFMMILKAKEIKNGVIESMLCGGLRSQVAHFY